MKVKLEPKENNGLKLRFMTENTLDCYVVDAFEKTNHSALLHKFVKEQYKLTSFKELTLNYILNIRYEKDKLNNDDTAYIVSVIYERFCNANPKLIEDILNVIPNTITKEQMDKIAKIMLYFSGIIILYTIGKLTKTDFFTNVNEIIIKGDYEI